MMDYSIVTVSDREPPADYFCLWAFNKSLQKYGVEPLVLSNELMGKSFNGSGSKPNWQFRAIKEGMIKTKYVFFVDCWDLFFAEHPDKAFEKYLEFNYPLVFNSEKNCFPHFVKEDYDKLDSGTSPYKYLNSGMIIGETDAILTALEAIGAPDIQEDFRKPDGSMWHQNDQQLWLDLFLKQPVKMALDYKQHICQTLHDVNINEFEFTERGIKNIETGAIPSIFHANGGGKTSGVKEPILKYLNLL
jgi:hypothetical protein